MYVKIAILNLWSHICNSVLFSLCLVVKLCEHCCGHKVVLIMLHEKDFNNGRIGVLLICGIMLRFVIH